MSLCNAVATWNEEGERFTLVLVGERPDDKKPFALASDSEVKTLTFQEGISLLVERKEKRLRTEFSPGVEEVLKTIRLEDWQKSSYQLPVVYV